MIRFQPSTARRSVSPLTDDQIRRAAPSVFATEPWTGVSARYRFIPTSEVVDMLREQNFLPIMAKQSRTRIPGKGDFTKHMIKFRHADMLNTLNVVGDEIPELLLVNSADRSSAYKFLSGIFRLICENGMIVMSDNFGEFKVRHTGDVDLKSQVIDASFQVMEAAPKAMDQINTWRSIELSPPQRLAFAESAKELIDNDNIKATQLIAPRRAADAKPDLYSTFNVVQENLTKGGLRTYTPSGRRSTTRPIKDIGKDVRLNRALWSLTEKMAELVG